MARLCITQMIRDIKMDNKNTIPGRFEAYTAQFPDHIAAVHGQQILSYDQLNQQANQLAHYLRSLGLNADTPVALCLERSLDFLITIIAILKAGGAYLPIDFSQPEKRLLFLLNDSQAPILITKAASAHKFSQYNGKIVLLDKSQALLDQQPSNNPSTLISEQHLAYIIYTSGSTGTPKGVLIEHRSIINYYQWLGEYTQSKVQQRIDFSASPIFDMAVSVSLAPLMLGLTIVICDTEIKKDSRAYLAYLADSQINTIKLTPSYFKLLVQEAKNNFIALPHLKSIILGGENLAAAECKDWLSIYPEHILYNEYGPTEATVAVSVYKVQRDNFTGFDIHVPIGKVGPKISYYILDKYHQPVADGEKGELAIGGICLARGYLNRPDLTQKQFITDFSNQEANARFYKTGDLCRKRVDGVIEYFGRIDDQVKIRGFRVEPREVESCLVSHSLIKSVAVVPQENERKEQQLVAYYVLENKNTELNTAQVREFLKKQIPDYMIPPVFIRVDFLPLTANGKLDKSALPLPKMHISHNYIEPVTALEKQLARIWSEELGVKLVGLKDNFFELGGHSLSAARLVCNINHTLKRDITLYDFYKATCIADLIPVLQHTKRSTKVIVNEKILETTPLSDFQFVLWMADTFEPKAKRLNIIARKRVKGHFDKEALDFAFQAVLKRHEVLIYYVFKLKPKQKASKNLSIKLVIKDLRTLSGAKTEQSLEQSMHELEYFKRWPKNAPLILARLFYLNEHESELQICMPHLISDNSSVDILFNDLSKFYLQKLNELEHPTTSRTNELLSAIEVDRQFKKYIFTEQQLLESSLEKDSQFWEKYLHNASFFAFPKKYIVRNMKKEKRAYSTYMPIPIETVSKLKHFCEQQHISMNNGLCTVLALALRNCCGSFSTDKSFKVMNIIKSTRDNPSYDNSIGCFLRVEPIKVALDNNETLESLSQQIQQSIIETSNHQHCSNLIKLSAVSTLNIKKKKIQSSLIKLVTPVFTKILQTPLIYRKILQRCISRFMLFKRNHYFVINLNVRNNFLAHDENQTQLFGFKSQCTDLQQRDLLAIDYIFEACFLYDEDKKIYYLVISANLTPEFKMKIAQEFVQIMGDISLDLSLAAQSN
ncbi:non-ribosomal peptide synthetase [Legionella longbeachae]|uniref:Putative non-ribosomal peptide synthetase n=2 Tax=Legionella longbeachae TaxID=450 RepID=D3HJN1_LEGLN|nr:non-ribosomal peptide synthetase [Legionella longbeachae]CBJ12627.1 putative non-ribosomal peptide synthetase [Legionella longbeachae NSW150]HBD7398963.1 amino acid adenylation domain-containing protein [Legionella pneumophila]ARM32922.1 amino acid adenylation domain-containing protein [Legionella longbeachae]QIN32885.1 amino acid adenylation domain-containing protein [Legionella longbeachae]